MKLRGRPRKLSLEQVWQVQRVDKKMVLFALEFKVSYSTIQKAFHKQGVYKGVEFTDEFNHEMEVKYG